MSETIVITATERVQQSAVLAAYRDLLLDYEWPDQDEHLEWVATAPEEEIVDWAETIRRDQAAS